MKQDSKVRFAAHYRKSDGIAQSLKEHLEGSSALASAFAGKIGLSSFGELIGLLHDFGKYTDVFLLFSIIDNNYSSSCITPDNGAAYSCR